ncbi:MAG TPA: hypothetical protein VH680_05300 [Gemmatimonadales bacterium]|jgi:hypothetical protein
MATIVAPEIGNPPVVKLPMRDYLTGLHEEWLEQVRSVLDPAREEAAGTWLRWRALEYLETGFKRRFERERRAVFSLHERLNGEQASHLWAGGELVAQLLDSLGRRVGLCQREALFLSVTATVMNAIEYWCRQVEDALGPVRWGDVTPESRILFETITYDDVLLGG